MQDSSQRKSGCRPPPGSPWLGSPPPPLGSLLLPPRPLLLPVLRSPDQRRNKEGAIRRTTRRGGKRKRWRVRRGCEWSAALDPCSPDGWQRRDPKRRMERSTLSPPNQRRRDPASCGCFRHFGVYGRSLLQSSDLSSQSQAHNPAYRSAGSGTSFSLLGVATASRETTCPARVPESQRSYPYIADRHQVFLGFFLVGEGRTKAGRGMSGFRSGTHGAAAHQSVC